MRDPHMTWLLALILAVTFLMIALLVVWTLDSAGAATRRRLRQWRRRR